MGMSSSLNFTWTLESYQRIYFLPERQLCVLCEEVLTLPELIFCLQKYRVPNDVSFVCISEGIFPWEECYNSKLGFHGCMPSLVPSKGTVEGCSLKLPTCCGLLKLCYREPRCTVLYWIWTFLLSIHRADYFKKHNLRIWDLEGNSYALSVHVSGVAWS